jgi:type IV pilus assembly protein PilA|tara:strand:- start:134 stop:655 length:522 start_codon:yes stop_codon:yes gene_type:complete
MKNKKNKGFTLIELLVVVAIIGILASVGVVAYGGYTASAKKASAKSNFNSVAKWTRNELQKCNIGETSAMDGALECSDADTPSEIAAAVIESQTATTSKMKNPWDTASPKTDAVSATALEESGCSTTTRGQIGVVGTDTAGATVLTITACTAAAEGEGDDAVTNWLQEIIAVE